MIDRLEILYGKYPYTIEFNPPPAKQMFTSKEKKRAHESDSESNDNLSEKKIKKEPSLDSNEDSLNFSLPSTCPNSQENCLLETKKIVETGKNLQPADKEIWEEFGRGTCLVFTSNGVIGRNKVSFLLLQTGKLFLFLILFFINEFFFLN